MFSMLRRNLERLRWAVPVLALSLVACELDVADPGVVTEDELAGPSSVPTTISGAVADLASATEHYVLYTSMFTDEMILAGTFPTRVEVDEREISQSNATVTGEVNETLQVARSQARRMDSLFQTFVGNEEFNQTAVAEGIAIGKYIEALMLLQLGELYCQIPIEAGGSPVPSDDIVGEALTKFGEAEAAASDAGLTDYENASIVGQARANLWLENYGAAATAASNVPFDHRLEVEFSTNDPDQFNKVWELTFGSQNEVIRWTVGAGLQGQRDAEEWALYDLFADSLGIVNPDPGLSAFNSNIDVQTQLIYDEADDNILISSGVHARLIEAEAAIRAGNAGAAETLIDSTRTTWQDRWTTNRFRVDVGLDGVNNATQAEFGANFTALTEEQQLRVLADELGRETWLSGVRQETLRRLAENDGIDLYPDRSGDQVCWPVPEQEETGALP